MIIHYSLLDGGHSIDPVLREIYAPNISELDFSDDTGSVEELLDEIPEFMVEPQVNNFSIMDLVKDQEKACECTMLRNMTITNCEINGYFKKFSACKNLHVKGTIR